MFTRTTIASGISPGWSNPRPSNNALINTRWTVKYTEWMQNMHVRHYSKSSVVDLLLYRRCQTIGNNQRADDTFVRPPHPGQSINKRETFIRRTRYISKYYQVYSTIAIVDDVPSSHSLSYICCSHVTARVAHHPQQTWGNTSSSTIYQGCVR